MHYQTALVTGASSGMGRGLCIALAARKTHVLCAARRRAQLDTLVDEIVQAGGSAEAIELDVSDANATFAAMRALDDKRAIDLVIANAGVGDFTPATHLDWSRISRVFSVNTVGAAATVCGALPGMIARRRGHIAAVASVAGFRGIPGLAAYSASKAAIINFMEGLRIELEGSGVHVTTLCPGYVATEMTANNKAGPKMLTVEEAVTTMLRALDDDEPLRVFPSSMAMAVKFLPLLPHALYAWIVKRQTKQLGDGQ